MSHLLSDNDKKVYLMIRNRLIHGFEPPTFREIIKEIGKSSPRSAALAIERIEFAGLIKRNSQNKIILTNESFSESKSIQTIEVPLIGTVSAGSPILAHENIETYITISTALAKKPNNYFLLRIEGDSMNLAEVNGVKIENKSIVLVRQQPVAEEGKPVVALIDDSATVKFLEKENGLVILRPKSTESKYKPIILTENCTIQGIVVAVLPKNLIN